MSESLVKRAEDASRSYHELVETLSSARARVVYGGKLLYQLKYQNTYKAALGEGIDTWADFLKLPEVGLSKGEAQRMMDIYEVFVKELGYSQSVIAEIPVKSLHYILPVAKEGDKEKVDELLEDARVLTQSDFKERLFDVKNPEGERTYEYIVMKRCKETGNMRKVHNLPTADIENAFGLQQHE